MERVKARFAMAVLTRADTSDYPENRMRKLVDGFDWGNTALGERAFWPAELESTVQQVLDSGFPNAIAWGPSLITIYNDAFRPILGNKEEALGRPFSDVWREAWGELGPIADQAMTGRSTFIENFPLVIQRDGSPENAYFTFCYHPLRLKDGSVGGMLDTVIETTETVEAQRKLDIANLELGHRLTNSLAIVQSIASQTLRPHCDADAFRAFEDRLDALSRAHYVLSHQNWTSISLRQTIDEALQGSADVDRVSIDGPDAGIGSRSTMALTMMLHELGINAVKYGALSQDAGRVDIRWTIKDGQMALRWQEIGGPPVKKPTRKGFGTRLLEIGVGSHCESAIEFDTSGLRFSFQVPLAELAR